MPEQIVTAIYRLKDIGHDQALRALIREHVGVLRRLGLATDRPVQVLKTFDGLTYVEIFGWVDGEASRRAHEAPEVGAIWGAMMEIADFPAFGDLEEGRRRFPHFVPVDDLGD